MEIRLFITQLLGSDCFLLLLYVLQKVHCTKSNSFAMLSPLDGVSKVIMFLDRPSATFVCSFIRPDRSCYHNIF